MAGVALMNSRVVRRDGKSLWSVFIMWGVAGLLALQSAAALALSLGGMTYSSAFAAECTLPLP